VVGHIIDTKNVDKLQDIFNNINNEILSRIANSKKVILYTEKKLDNLTLFKSNTVINDTEENKLCIIYNRDELLNNITIDFIITDTNYRDEKNSIKIFFSAYNFISANINKYTKDNSYNIEINTLYVKDRINNVKEQIYIKITIIY